MKTTSIPKLEGMLKKDLTCLPDETIEDLIDELRVYRDLQRLQYEYIAAVTRDYDPLVTKHGLSPSFICQILNKKHIPKPGTRTAIIIRRTVAYYRLESLKIEKRAKSRIIISNGKFVCKECSKPLIIIRTITYVNSIDKESGSILFEPQSDKQIEDKVKCSLNNLHKPGFYLPAPEAERVVRATDLRRTSEVKVK
jgi:hypothetical protein